MELRYSVSSTTSFISRIIFPAVGRNPQLLILNTSRSSSKMYKRVFRQTADTGSAADGLRGFYCGPLGRVGGMRAGPKLTYQLGVISI